jgi:hypothetical protein
VRAIDVVKILSDPRRLQVLAAVTLGAATTEAVAERSGVDARGIRLALGALEGAGLVVNGPRGVEVHYGRLRELAAPAGAAADDDVGHPRPELKPFVRGDRLHSMPSRQSRRHAVLSHIAETSFAPGVVYDESAVNDVLQRWCEESDVDHVAIRRYLIDHKLLFRAKGVYVRSPKALPEPDCAMRHVEADGLG